MSTRTVTRKDGSRLVHRSEDGASWVEHDKAKGVVARTYIVAPDRYSTGGTASLVEPGRTTRPARPAASTTSRPSRPIPVRSIGGPACDVRVELADKVIDGICRSALWQTGCDGEKETGGWLAGWADGGTVTVTTATGPGDRSVRKRDSLSLDMAGLKALEKLAASGACEKPIGNFHTHPRTAQPELDHWPSTADFESWEAGFERAGGGAYIGLIATAGPDGSWGAPVFHAWVTTRSSYGGLVTQPARIARL